MKMAIDWKNGEPEKDGKYYICKEYTKYDYVTGTNTKYIDINTLDFTVRYGWNTSKLWGGKYSMSPDYDPIENEKMWSNIVGWAEVEEVA